MAAFDKDRFEATPDPEYICAICHCIFDNPHETPCRHVFCKVCIETWIKSRNNGIGTTNYCPSCREPVRIKDIKPALPLVCNVINKLRVKCIYSSNGCAVVIAKEHIQNHEKNCTWQLVKCRNFGCGKSHLVMDRDKHEAECEMKLVICKEECQLALPRRDMKNHKCILAQKKKIKELEHELQSSRALIKDILSGQVKSMANVVRHQTSHRTSITADIFANVRSHIRRYARAIANDPESTAQFASCLMSSLQPDSDPVENQNIHSSPDSHTETNTDPTSAYSPGYTPNQEYSPSSSYRANHLSLREYRPTPIPRYSPYSPRHSNSSHTDQQRRSSRHELNRWTNSWDLYNGESSRDVVNHDADFPNMSTISEEDQDSNGSRHHTPSTNNIDNHQRDDQDNHSNRSSHQSPNYVHEYEEDTRLSLPDNENDTDDENTRASSQSLDEDYQSNVSDNSNLSERSYRTSEREVSESDFTDRESSNGNISSTHVSNDYEDTVSQSASTNQQEESNSDTEITRVHTDSERDESNDSDIENDPTRERNENSGTEVDVENNTSDIDDFARGTDNNDDPYTGNHSDGDSESNDCVIESEVREYESPRAYSEVSHRSDTSPHPHYGHSENYTDENSNNQYNYAENDVTINVCDNSNDYCDNSTQEDHTNGFPAHNEIHPNETEDGQRSDVYSQQRNHSQSSREYRRKESSDSSRNSTSSNSSDHFEDRGDNDSRGYIKRKSRTHKISQYNSSCDSGSSSDFSSNDCKETKSRNVNPPVFSSHSPHKQHSSKTSSNARVVSLCSDNSLEKQCRRNSKKKTKKHTKEEKLVKHENQEDSVDHVSEQDSSFNGPGLCSTYSPETPSRSSDADFKNLLDRKSDDKSSESNSDAGPYQNHKSDAKLEKYFSSEHGDHESKTEDNISEGSFEPDYTEPESDVEITAVSNKDTDYDIETKVSEVDKRRASKGSEPLTRKNSGVNDGQQPSTSGITNSSYDSNVLHHRKKHKYKRAKRIMPDSTSSSDENESTGSGSSKHRKHKFKSYSYKSDNISSYKSSSKLRERTRHRKKGNSVVSSQNFSSSSQRKSDAETPQRKRKKRRSNSSDDERANKKQKFSR